MIKKETSTNTPHKMPVDLKKILSLSPEAQVAWDNSTPLARNEWICWVESAKKIETRNHRIDRACRELTLGKRRPCCWPGCPHR